MWLSPPLLDAIGRQARSTRARWSCAWAGTHVDPTRPASTPLTPAFGLSRSNGSKRLFDAPMQYTCAPLRRTTGTKIRGHDARRGSNAQRVLCATAPARGRCSAPRGATPTRHGTLCRNHATPHTRCNGALCRKMRDMMRGRFVPDTTHGGCDRRSHGDCWCYAQTGAACSGYAAHQVRVSAVGDSAPAARCPLLCVAAAAR